MRVAINLVAGLIFGIGLVVSGMANPQKVLNFLDISGAFDPSLAFVMAGAIAVTATGYALIIRRSKPLLEDAFQIPAKGSIDQSLLVGAAMFGIGWGLSGFCPGPALTSRTLAEPGTLVFLPAMLIGVATAVFLKRRT